MLGSSWRFCILILVLVMQFIVSKFEYGTVSFSFFLKDIQSLFVFPYFMQNFQKDLMVLIVVFICLIILIAGLRMFMYDFLFHNLFT